MRLSGRCGLTEGPFRDGCTSTRGRILRRSAVVLAAAAVVPGLVGATGAPGARVDVAQGAALGLSEHASAVIGSSERRFRVRTTSGGLVGRSGGMQVAFRRSGPSFAGRGFSLGFRSPSIGRGTTMTPLSSARPLAQENSVLYRRRSTTEWYRNGPFGVEQGFTVHRRPAGTQSAPLAMSFRLSGSLVEREVGSSVATSAPFVSEGSPPIVSITRPRTRARIAAGASLDLAGSAYDDAGHRLTGRSLVWHVGRETLGKGNDITTEVLAPGRHTVMLTAHDRRGRTQSASVTVTVLAAPPALIAFKAPARISPRARSATLTLATAAPATLTIGRFHSLVGRRPRTIRVQIKPGTKPLKLTLMLSSGSYRNRVAVVVAR